MVRPCPRPGPDLFARLEALGIETATVEHAAVFTVEDYEPVVAHLPGAHCKSLFLKDKKGALWLIVTRQSRALNLNKLAKGLGAARFSFARPELLMEVLGIPPGSASPFALINDTDRRVTVILDAEMMADSPLNYHPLDNTTTTAIEPGDLRRFLADCGNEVRGVELNPFAPAPA